MIQYSVVEILMPVKHFSYADMIGELINRRQQVDAVHFTYEVGLVDKFPPVPLLKAFLKDSKKAATSILEDPNHIGRAVVCLASIHFE